MKGTVNDLGRLRIRLEARYVKSLLFFVYVFSLKNLNAKNIFNYLAFIIYETSSTFSSKKFWKVLCHLQASTLVCEWTSVTG